MIKIICGPKGFGKTKQIIDDANGIINTAKGHVVFINDTKRYMYDLAREIRVIDTNDYKVAGEDALMGFIKGIIACNTDTQYVYLDGVARITGKELKDLAAFFYMLDKIADEYGLTVTLTISGEKESIPDFIAKYI